MKPASSTEGAVSPGRSGLRSLSLRCRSDQSGFSFVEVVVVLAVVAIILGITLPVVLGLLDSGSRSEASADVQQAVNAARSRFASVENYSELSPSSLETQSNGITFATYSGSPPKSGVVLMTTSTYSASASGLSSWVSFAAVGAGDTCFLAFVPASGAPTYNKIAEYSGSTYECTPPAAALPLSHLPS